MSQDIELTDEQKARCEKIWRTPWDATYGGVRCVQAAMREGIAIGRAAAPEVTRDSLAVPIPMVLHCPSCGEQHIDAPSETWNNPPHRSHLCLRCGTIWRPADVPTTGVQSIQTKGRADYQREATSTRSAEPDLRDGRVPEGWPTDHVRIAAERASKATPE